VEAVAVRSWRQEGGLVLYAAVVFDFMPLKIICVKMTSYVIKHNCLHSFIPQTIVVVNKIDLSYAAKDSCYHYAG
jgi:hypothetical protein